MSAVKWGEFWWIKNKIPRNSKKCKCCCASLLHSLWHHDNGQGKELRPQLPLRHWESSCNSKVTLLSFLRVLRTFFLLLPPPSPPWVSQSIYLSCSWLWGKHICDWNPAEVQKEEKNSRALEVLLYVNLNQSCSDSFLIPSGISRTSTNFPIDFWKYIPTADDDKVHQSALNIFIILGLLHDLRNFWMQICNSMVFNLMRGGGGRKWIWGHSSWKI